MTKPLEATPSGPLKKRRGITGRLINSYYIEIGYLLDRVEQSNTHYQTLGVPRTAPKAEVLKAYHGIVSSLHPTDQKVRASVPEEMMKRIDKTFGKITDAFSVLTDSTERAKYDRSLQRPSRRPIQVEIPRQVRQPVQADAPGHAASQDSHTILGPPASTQAAAKERRRSERYNLAVPVLVTGHDQSGEKWKEVAKTVNVGRLGAAILIAHPIRLGSVLFLRIPMPLRLRNHGHSEPGYNVYAVVRRIDPAEREGSTVIAVEFIGEHPPSWYVKEPWAICTNDTWNGPERRREARLESSLPVWVEFLNESMKTISHATAVAENISPSGIRVSLKVVPAQFEFVRVSHPDTGFKSQALVRSRFRGEDGSERLCLQFTERKWPVE
jgi:hypothetical protein